MLLPLQKTSANQTQGPQDHALTTATAYTGIKASTQRLDMLHIDTLSLPGRRYFYCSACSVCGKALYRAPLASDSLCPDEVHHPWITQADK